MIISISKDFDLEKDLTDFEIFVIYFAFKIVSRRVCGLLFANVIFLVPKKGFR